MNFHTEKRSEGMEKQMAINLSTPRPRIAVEFPHGIEHIPAVHRPYTGPYMHGLPMLNHYPWEPEPMDGWYFIEKVGGGWMAISDSQN